MFGAQDKPTGTFYPEGSSPGAPDTYPIAAAQGLHLDWPAIAASGVRFAICKATEHVGYTPTFARNAVAAAQAGLIVGSYHVLRPEADVARQARHYFDVASARSELLPVLDFELTGGVAGPEVHRRAIAFVEATEALWGQTVHRVHGRRLLGPDRRSRVAGARGAAALGRAL